jgi:hypothetical protein
MMSKMKMTNFGMLSLKEHPTMMTCGLLITLNNSSNNNNLKNRFHSKISLLIKELGPLQGDSKHL